MSYCNVVDFLGNRRGFPYAAEVIETRIKYIKDELARVQVEIGYYDELDCQERDDQLYREGKAAGLIAALGILGVEVEE
jgi:hypothetical protein